jgi:hypothetical protein
MRRVLGAILLDWTNSAGYREVVFSVAYDEERLLMMLLHSGPRSTQEDFDANIAALEQLARDAARRPSTRAALVVIVETNNPPDAVTRKRLTEPIRSVRNIDGAFVVQSKAIHMVATAILWFAPKNHGHSVHGNYEDARDWLVARTMHPRSVLDGLHSKLRKPTSRTTDKPASS